jgi:L-threonylcarbamoyladenylate synthase
MPIIDPKTIKLAAQFLTEEKLVAMPTETVYGLAGSARSATAIQKIYTLKGRPATNPLIIHLSHPAAISNWASHIPKSAQKLAKEFWPGPLTLVLPRHPEVLSSVTAGQDTVALRIPNHPVALALLQEFKDGLAAPSANRSGRISPTTISHVKMEFQDKVDFYLDGGSCTVGIESTIIYLIDSEAIILRKGNITQQALEETLGHKVLVKDHQDIGIQVPGTTLSHYAPENPLFLLPLNLLLEKVTDVIAHHKTVGVLSFSKKPALLSNKVHWISASANASTYASLLYARLRELDALNPTCILIETPPEGPDWEAIHDRLTRASYTESSGKS